VYLFLLVGQHSVEDPVEGGIMRVFQHCFRRGSIAPTMSCRSRAAPSTGKEDPRTRLLGNCGMNQRSGSFNGVGSDIYSSTEISCQRQCQMPDLSKNGTPLFSSMGPAFNTCGTNLRMMQFDFNIFGWWQSILGSLGSDSRPIGDSLYEWQVSARDGLHQCDKAMAARDMVKAAREGKTRSRPPGRAPSSHTL